MNLTSGFFERVWAVVILTTAFCFQRPVDNCAKNIFLHRKLTEIEEEILSFEQCLNCGVMRRVIDKLDVGRNE